MASLSSLKAKKHKYEKMNFLDTDRMIDYFSQTLPGHDSVYKKIIPNLNIETISEQEMVRRTGGSGLAYTDGENIVLTKYPVNFFFELKEDNKEEQELAMLEKLNDLMFNAMAVHEVAHNRVEDPVTQVIRKGLKRVYDEIFEMAKKYKKNQQEQFDKEYAERLPKWKEIVVKDTKKALKDYNVDMSEEEMVKYYEMYLISDNKISSLAKSLQNAMVDIFIENEIHLYAHNKEESQYIYKNLEILRRNAILKSMDKYIEILEMSPEKIDRINFLQAVTQIYIDPRFREEYSISPKYRKLFKNEIWEGFLEIQLRGGITVKEALNELYEKSSLMANYEFGKKGLVSYKMQNNVYSQLFNYYSARIVEIFSETPDLSNCLDNQQKQQNQDQNQDNKQDQNQSQDNQQSQDGDNKDQKNNQDQNQNQDGENQDKTQNQNDSNKNNENQQDQKGENQDNQQDQNQNGQNGDKQDQENSQNQDGQEQNQDNQQSQDGEAQDGQDQNQSQDGQEQNGEGQDGQNQDGGNPSQDGNQGQNGQSQNGNPSDNQNNSQQGQEQNSSQNGQQGNNQQDSSNPQRGNEGQENSNPENNQNGKEQSQEGQNQDGKGQDGENQDNNQQQDQSNNNNQDGKGQEQNNNQNQQAQNQDNSNSSQDNASDGMDAKDKTGKPQHGGNEKENKSNNDSQNKGEEQSNESKPDDSKQTEKAQQTINDIKDSIKGKSSAEMAMDSFDDFTDQAQEAIKEIAEQIEKINEDILTKQQGKDIKGKKAKDEKEKDIQRNTDPLTKEDKDLIQHLEDAIEIQDDESHKHMKNLETKKTVREIEKKHKKLIRKFVKEIENKLTKFEQVVQSNKKGSTKNMVSNYIKGKKLKDLYVTSSLMLQVNSLLDGSGSMGGWRMDTMKECMTLMKIILEKIEGVLLNIYNFDSSWDGPVLNKIQNFDGMDPEDLGAITKEKDKGMKNLLALEAGGGTPLTPTLIKTIQLLKKQQRDTVNGSSAILFVFSDGDDTSGRHYQEVSKKLVNSLQQDNSVLIKFIGIENNALERYYGSEHFIQVNGIDDFLEFFYEQISDIIDMAIDNMDTKVSKYKLNNVSMGM